MKKLQHSRLSLVVSEAILVDEFAQHPTWADLYPLMIETNGYMDWERELFEGLDL